MKEYLFLPFSLPLFLISFVSLCVSCCIFGFNELHTKILHTFGLNFNLSFIQSGEFEKKRRGRRITIFVSFSSFLFFLFSSYSYFLFSFLPFLTSVVRRIFWTEARSVNERKYSLSNSLVLIVKKSFVLRNSELLFFFLLFLVFLFGQDGPFRRLASS